MTSNKIVQLSPFIGAFLIFCGYIKLHTYYSNWGINISDYLDFSEIILSFLNDITIFLIFIISIFFKDFVGDILITIFDKKNTINNFVENAEKEVRYGSLIISVIAFIIFFSLFEYIKNYWVLFLAIFASIQLVPEILDKVFKLEYNFTSTLLSIIFSLFFFSYLSSQYKIKETTSNNQQITCYENNKILIQSTKQILYIGKTNKYFYFFDTSNKKALIYKADNINLIATEVPN